MWAWFRWRSDLTCDQYFFIPVYIKVPAAVSLWMQHISQRLDRWAPWVHCDLRECCVCVWMEGSRDGQYNGWWWGLKMTEASHWPAPRGCVPGSCVISAVWLGGGLWHSWAGATVMLFSWLSEKVLAANACPHFASFQRNKLHPGVRQAEHFSHSLGCTARCTSGIHSPCFWQSFCWELWKCQNKKLNC